MKISWTLALLLLISSLAGSYAAEPRFNGDGIEIDAGSLGKYLIDYPNPLNSEQKAAHKLLEKNVAGRTAVLKYDGGVEIDLTVGEGGKVQMKIEHGGNDVKFLDLEMHVPIALNQGGRWKIGDAEAAFPKEKPAKPHLYQGHATALRIIGYDGRSLWIRVPENSYQQLTDNREWNWGIFHWKSTTPLDPNRPELTMALGVAEPPAGAKPPALVDEFGQSAREDWPDKVKTIEELKSDTQSEKAYYAGFHPPQLDVFGGLPGSRERLGLRGSGFFHLEKKGERWFLTDPAGNAFFHLGVCGVSPGDDYTLVKGRESAYQWLPPRDGEFRSAFRRDSGDGVVSFHLVNMIRKYERPYDPEEYTAQMIGRIRKWGFNSAGAFSDVAQKARESAQFPFVAHLPLSEWEGVPRLPGIRETFDPFDEKTRARIVANFTKSLPERASDPLIIGYFITNEPAYEDIPRVVPALNRTYACKRRFVQWLTDKYKAAPAFAAAWETAAASFDELNDRVLDVKSAAAKQDVSAFAGVFLDEYFRFVSETFRRSDANHLLLGSRLQPGTIDNEQLCRICGKYLDVMSFNYYTLGVDKELLQRIGRWTGGRPMMLSEFYWASPKDTGLEGGREVANQRERGLAYRNYLEQSASLGFVIGIEWFTLVDQSVTGRWFSGFDGERANTGIVSVTDRPWKGMLQEAAQTNYDIYRVWFGDRKPFAWEDPRFRVPPVR